MGQSILAPDVKKTVYLTGPTASGKTSRAVLLAKALDGEIISVDSRQVYRGMDLGTGKDLAEYDGVAYHLIDVADAGEKYNLYRYLKDYRTVETSLRQHGRRIIACGGTGLYLESVINGINLPEVPVNEKLRTDLSGLSLDRLTEILAGMKRLHNRSDTDTVARAIRAIEIETYYQSHPDEAATAQPSPEKDPVIIGVDIDRETRRQRIFDRLEQRLAQGMIEEVRGLVDKGVDPGVLLGYGLEYKYITLFVLGNIDYGKMKEDLYTAICQFAKRQMTWFRGMKRRGFEIEWLPFDMPDGEFVDTVKDIVAGKEDRNE